MICEKRLNCLWIGLYWSCCMNLIQCKKNPCHNNQLFVNHARLTWWTELFSTLFLHLSHHIKFRLQTKNATFIFVKKTIVNPPYWSRRFNLYFYITLTNAVCFKKVSVWVIPKAKHCLSALFKMKTPTMPSHKSNVPVLMAIAISTGNFPSNFSLENTSATVKQPERSFHLTDTKPSFFSCLCTQTCNSV